MKKLIPFLFLILAACEESQNVQSIPVDSIPENVSSCSVPMVLTTWQGHGLQWRIEIPHEPNAITYHMPGGAQCDVEVVLNPSGCDGSYEVMSAELIDGYGDADCSQVVGLYQYQIQGDMLVSCKDDEPCKGYQAINVEGEL